MKQKILETLTQEKNIELNEAKNGVGRLFS